MATQVEVIISARNMASRALQNVNRDVDDIGKKAEASGSRTKRAFSGIAMAAGPLGAAMAGAFAVDKILGFAKAAADAATESRRIGRQTEAVIKSTGGAANVTAGDVDKLAGSIAGLTGVDDEAVASGQNLLLTFTNVRNEVGKGNDIFNQATKTAVDMAAALNNGAVTADTLKGANIQLGKALNDPIKGISALSRVGVSFTDQQKEQIRTLVESGKTMDAQKIILAELGKEFGGQAAASATPMKLLQVRFGNFQEALGGILLKGIDAAANFTMKVMDGISTFVGGFRGAVRRVRDIFGRDGMEGVLNYAGRRIGLVLQEQLPIIAGKLARWGEALVEWVAPRIPPLLLELGKAWLAIQRWMLLTALPAITRQLGKWALAFVQWVGPQIPVLVEKLGELLKRLTNWARDTALPAIRVQMSQWASAALDWVTAEVIPFIGAKLDDLWDKMREKLVGENGIKGKLLNAGTAMGKSLINAMIGQLNNGIHGVEHFINRFGNAIDSVAGKLGLGDLIPEVTIPRIPTYAKGTQHHPGGMAIVGEQGPELVRLPKGAQVMTAEQTRKIMGAIGGSVIAGSQYRWPGGLVRYAFPQPDFPNKRRVYDAAAYISNRANVRFAEEKYKPGVGDVLKVWSTPGENSAAVGKRPGLNVVRLDPGADIMIATHEWLHALGMWHEQSRRDRDRHVGINWQNIQAGKEHNFQKAANGIDVGPYDYGSLMHYNSMSFSKNGRPTINSFGHQIGQRSRMSAGDIATLRYMYPKAAPPPAIDPITKPAPVPAPKPKPGIIERIKGVLDPRALLTRALSGIGGMGLPGVLGQFGPALIGRLTDAVISYVLSKVGIGPGPTTGPGVVDGWVKPLSSYRVTQEFGGRLLNYGPGGHHGIDLAAAIGSRIGAPTGGRVAFAGWDNTGFGNMVAIVRDDLRVILGHMSRIVARMGELLRPGQHVGDVGSSGRSTGPHLHLETQRNGTPINPRTYLPGLERGGPVTKGMAYIVGERRPEVFVPHQNGHVYPSGAKAPAVVGGPQLENYLGMILMAAIGERRAKALVEAAYPERANLTVAIRALDRARAGVRY